jgi:hypothetical protein
MPALQINLLPHLQGQNGSSTLHSNTGIFLSHSVVSHHRRVILILICVVIKSILTTYITFNRWVLIPTVSLHDWSFSTYARTHKFPKCSAQRPAYGSHGHSTVHFREHHTVMTIKAIHLYTMSDVTAWPWTWQWQTNPSQSFISTNQLKHML